MFCSWEFLYGALTYSQEIPLYPSMLFVVVVLLSYISSVFTKILYSHIAGYSLPAGPTDL